MKSLIIKGIQKYIEETNAKGFVIGISGGKDSTVVAKLLCEAIGKENVLGVMMPFQHQSDLNDSINVCNLLGIDNITVQIEDSCESLINSIENVTENIRISDKSWTNILPRIRMTTLYAIAQSIGYRVAGTGNRSERYIGWFTKHGDGGFDYNPIAPLCCTEVVKLGDELGLPYDLVHKVPMDGLTGRSDEHNFGFSYKELDDYIINGSSGNEDLDKKIEDMHNMSKHKIGGGYTSALPTKYGIVYDLPWIDEGHIDNELLDRMDTVYINELIQ